MAPRRRVGGAWHIAFDRWRAAALAGYRGEQRARIGVARRGEDGVRAAFLDDASQIHHGHAIGDVTHNAQVMADEDEGQAEVADQVGQQVHHLRLHRDIERAHRLIPDHELGAGGERARDRDALALPAGKFMRPARGELRPQANAREHFGHPVAHGRAGDDVVQDERLGHRLLHRHARVEAAEGVLEDQLHVASARPQRAR